MNSTLVDFIPVCWIEPAVSTPRGVVIWLPGFSGTKEPLEPHLRAFAEAGFVAVSFDPWQHGQRRVEPNEELLRRILGNIHKHFWPILAHTTEETSRVIDWATATFQVAGPIHMGGISMGGDISVAAAGIDHRIARVAACIATPDWLRPGSHQPQGTPDIYAQRCYDRGNPLTNLDRYAHGPAITFQCGVNDTQVPPDGATRFTEALVARHPSTRGRIEVIKHAGIGHALPDVMLRKALAWLTTAG